MDDENNPRYLLFFHFFHSTAQTTAPHKNACFVLTRHDDNTIDVHMFSGQVDKNLTLLDVSSIQNELIYTIDITPAFDSDRETALSNCVGMIDSHVYLLTMDETTATQEGGRNTKKRKTRRQKKKCYRRSRRIRKQIRK
jgi:hypothetical protein